MLVVSSFTTFSESSVELIDHMGDDMRACHAARVSLLRDGDDLQGNELSGRDVQLIHFLMREKHTSPFEHSVITFRVHAPLPVVAQIMRHRTFSYNQGSRRYTSDQLEFFNATEWRLQGEKNLQCSAGALDPDKSALITERYREHCVSSLNLYWEMIELGCSREQARLLLPQGLMARFYMTGNLHNYLKFLILRDSEHAQPECREIAVQMRAHLKNIFPVTLQFFEDALNNAGQV